MKKSVLNKTLITLVIILAIIILTNNIVLGTVNTNITISNRLVNEVEPIGNRLIGVLQIVGTFISVAMTMVIGIRFMVCSVEEKAEYKKAMAPYLVGAILIFSSANIVKLIYNFFN